MIKLAAAVLCAVTAGVSGQSLVSSSAARSTATLWHDPGAIADEDLRWGAGSALRPPLAPFTFVKEDMSASKPKVRVTDANGVA